MAFNFKFPDADWIKIGAELLKLVKENAEGWVTYSGEAAGKPVLIVVARGERDITNLKQQLRTES